MVRGHVGLAGVGGVGMTVALGRGPPRSGSGYWPLDVGRLILGQSGLPPEREELLARDPQVADEHLHILN